MQPEALRFDFMLVESVEESLDAGREVGTVSDDGHVIPPGLAG